MTADQRRRNILEILCIRRYETRENLAFEFSVSKRTIENDVLLLSLEYPIYTMRGKNGGIYVEEWFSLNKKYLSAKQYAVLAKLSGQVCEDDAKTLVSIMNEFNAPR